MNEISSQRMISSDDGLRNFGELKLQFSWKKETAHQQDTEEQAMMAWETLDDSMIDKAEEENGKADETKIEDTEDDEFNF